MATVIRRTASFARIVLDVTIVPGIVIIIDIVFILNEIVARMKEADVVVVVDIVVPVVRWQKTVVYRTIVQLIPSQAGTETTIIVIFIRTY